MNNDALLRYSRQILLPDIDISGQEKLLNAKVLVIGLGGLGSPVALYLASAGIGHLSLVDDDAVDISNLQRQIIHDSTQIGQAKTTSAYQQLQRLNPTIRYELINTRLDDQALTQQVADHDIVLDCTDNFSSRFAINQACVQQQTPLISGAVIRMEGQITSFDFRQANQACYRCLYHDQGESADTCSTTGILAPVAGIIGSIQATEAIKLLVGLPSLAGRLQILNAKYMQWRDIKLRKDPHCPVCGSASQHH
ncbi:MAG TPA: molybdopterin-synthase adenylyltransferase MoeB [Thiothrix sp.]|nr:molybdopterin-synthase adenylyltransferase MoeB [Thiothrix sp.]